MQQKKSWTVAAEFQRYAMWAGWPDSTLITHFERGLQQHMKNMLKFYPDLPKTFNEYVRKVASLEARDRQLSASSSNRAPSNSAIVQEQKKEADPDAMDIDCLSVGQRDRYRREGRCFECGGKGHLVRDCPRRKPRNPQSGRFERRNVRATEAELEQPNKVTQLRAILADLNPDEKDEFLNHLENSGF